MADAGGAPDVRVFVRAQCGRRARCAPADAAMDIRALLARVRALGGRSSRDGLILRLWRRAMGILCWYGKP